MLWNDETGNRHARIAFDQRIIAIRYPLGDAATIQSPRRQRLRYHQIIQAMNADQIH